MKQDFNEIDLLLDELKNKNSEQMEDAKFKSVADFKAEFFEKAEKLPRKRWKFWKLAPVSVGIAAALCFAFTLMMPNGEKQTLDEKPVTEAGEWEMAMGFTDDAPAAGACGIAADMVSVLAQVRGCDGIVARNFKFASDGNFPAPQFNTEEYTGITERGFIAAIGQPISTFGADVDTASYTNARRYLLNNNGLPPVDAVRSEEFINYFHYDYKAPTAGEKFAVNFELGDCPWKSGNKLLLVGLQAKMPPKEDKLPPSNFVFLVDNSGSMYDSMSLVIESMTTLAGKMRAGDTISLVTYGGGVEVLLDGVKGTSKAKIPEQLEKLRSGGYTPGHEGIQKAYALAHKHFIKKGNNRIILITDGDFNVGLSSESDLIKLVEKERNSGIYLTALGCGMGNYKDNKLKMLANKGNGNYAYLDTVREAKRVLETEFGGSMFTLARDVKLQLEFNPQKVYAYRLIGYELRHLENRDFRDDTKDAGEVGMGHQVTALYELVMADAPEAVKKAAVPSFAEVKSKYQTTSPVAGKSDEMLTFRLRYREPEGDAPATEKEFVLKENQAKSGDNLQWASAAAEFAMLLRNSEYKGEASYDAVRERAKKYLGDDPGGERAEFLVMLRNAADMKRE